MVSIWFGRPGEQIELEHPRGGVQSDRDRPSAVFRTGTGGARVGQSVGGKRQFVLNWERVWYETYAAMEGYFHGHEGPGPFALHDSGRINWLTVNQSGATSQTNDPTGFAAWQATGADRPSNSSARISAVDNATVSVTGDLDVAVDVTGDDWIDGTIRVLAAQFETTGNQKGWKFGINATGFPFLIWTSNGSTENTLTADTLPEPDSTGRLALRVKFDVNNGASGRTATFETAPDIDGDWTELDSQTSATATSIHDSTAPIEIGSADGGDSVFVGVYHAAWIKRGIDGTTLASPRFNEAAPGATQITDDQNVIWTLTSPSVIVGDYDSIDNLSSSASAYRRGPRSLRWDIASDNAAPAASASMELDTLVVLPATDTWPGIPIVPDLPICYSAYIRTVGAGPVATFTPRLEWLDKDGVTLSTSSGSSTAPPGTTWTQINVTATPPANAAYVKPLIRAVDGPSSPVGNVVVFLDEFQLEFGSAPTDWRPGTGIFPVQVLSLTERWPWQASDYRERVAMVLQEAGPG